MSDLNQCSFIGRLGKAPETRVTAGGDAICNFSIACGWKTKTKEGTEWINISTFGKLAEICGQYLEKGSQVYVQGKMKTDKFEDKSGVTKYSTKISADTVQFLSKASGNAEPQRAEPPRVTNLNQPRTAFDDMEDDIPFF
jgi:single-strand DNA-binding protein